MKREIDDLFGENNDFSDLLSNNSDNNDPVYCQS